MKLATVIAAYDERGNVEVLTRRLAAALDAVPGASWEMIFVVEGTDGSREAIERLSAAEGWPVRVLWRERPEGLGRAFRRGFAAVPADADLVITMDADLNHQPEEIPRLVADLLGRDLDVLVGSRFVAGSVVRGTPLWKRFLSGTMNRLMRLLYGLSVHDKTSGYRIYRREALAGLAFRNGRFAFLPEILILANNAGLRIGESPIRFLSRVEGRSKMRILPTTWSYVTLLSARFRPASTKSARRGRGQEQRAADDLDARSAR